jgi:hypothetical protein
MTNVGWQKLTMCPIFQFATSYTTFVGDALRLRLPLEYMNFTGISSISQKKTQETENIPHSKWSFRGLLKAQGSSIYF